ncbi:flagellar biosynthesis protein FliO [Rhizobium sp. 0TCS1.26]|uniref:flagellar biosynthetic protein FliO n=1 Tax=Rhizobium sp. 0TCS1.26 TaxID=3142623 RepID=UPI003D2D4EB0
MIEELMSDYGGRLFIAVGGVGLGFLCLVAVLLMLRRRSGPSPFLRGGKNRQPRLQVLDAAAVDARRRIVLVRRDDVEHLVMIGGPTDVVIESGIRPQGLQTVGYAEQGGETTSLSDETPAEPRLQAPPRQISSAGERLASATVARSPAAEPVAAVAPQPAAQAAVERPVSARPTTQRPIPERPLPERTAAQRPVATPPVERQMAEPAAPHVTAEAPVRDMPPTPQPRPAQTARPVEPPAPDVLPEPAAPMPTSLMSAAPMSAAPISVTPVSAPAIPAAERRQTENAAPDIGAATDALDAARQRVFHPTPQAPAPAASIPSPAPFEITAPAAAAPAIVANAQPPQAPVSPAPSRPLGSDFDRILEEEMANNLALERDGAEPATSVPALPPRDPAQPRVTGATPDPSLQTEIARIFGEMSVNRNDR